MPPANMTSASNSSAYVGNPVPALIARRTTVLAPPSLSTVNHLDGATTAAATSASSSSSASASATASASASNLRPPANAVSSSRRHRPDLQQAVSQPTAAVPVSTNENISTSKTWSSGLYLRDNDNGGQGATSHHQRKSSTGHVAQDAEGFAVHPTFRSDAEWRGDVLVRVEGVEFWVHKDVLLFASPFFKSVLAGGWSESRLSILIDAEVEQTAEEAWQPGQQKSSSTDTAMDRSRQRSAHDGASAGGDSARKEDPLQFAFSTEVAEESPSEDEAHDQRSVELDLDMLGIGESRPRDLLRASYHTALWSPDDESRASPTLFQDTVEGAVVRTVDVAESDGAEEESTPGSDLAAEEDQPMHDVMESRGIRADRFGDGEECGHEQVRSKERHSAALEKRESALRQDHTPAWTTSPILDPGSEQTASAQCGSQQRMQSLATPPLSRQASDDVQVGRAAPPPAISPADPATNTKAAAEHGEPTTATVTPAAGGRNISALPPRYQGIISVVDLTEESASTFHDFLFHIYPHLDLSVTWYNCGPLLRFSDKFQVPFLRRSCITFLRAALAGRPIEAMRLAELHSIDDLYREASRHVLDNFAAWLPDELAVLSSETLLKLERKRTWFLERLLKLGLANPGRDYECHAACPDPQACARALHDKWQMAYKAAFRYSPPQPSVIFRYLRELDSIGVGISGISSTNGTSTIVAAGIGSGGAGVLVAPLQLSNCQAAARVWVQGLFDRMFELGTLHTGRLFLAIKLDAGVARNVVHAQ